MVNQNWSIIQGMKCGQWTYKEVEVRVLNIKSNEYI